MDNVNQLADLIMAIIQDKVDERIEQRVNDLSEGVSEFDIQDHRQEITDMVEEDIDLGDKIQDALGMVTFTTTMD
jgi:enoyl-[acyl-carrier-protein] reductase (NADH)